MNAGLIAHPGAARAAVFFLLLALMLALERWRPKRRTDLRRGLRWPANFGLMAVNAAVLFALPVAAVGSSLWAARHGVGLLNMLRPPGWLAVALGWLLLDAAIYWQHRALHEIGWLWPLHRPHHTDVEFDASTALRFHPAEIALSMLFKCAVVIALGAPPLAVLLFETALNGLALFNHANLHLPAGLDRILRRLLVTPDMHRVHHSVHRVEHDSNYGNALSWWDHLFGSYTPAPRDGHAAMRIGLEQFRDDGEQRLLPLLRQPLAGRN